VSELDRSVKELFKTFLEPDAEVDDFQNVISSSLSKYTPLVKFS